MTSQGKRGSSLLKPRLEDVSSDRIDAIKRNLSTLKQRNNTTTMVSLNE